MLLLKAPLIQHFSGPSVSEAFISVGQFFPLRISLGETLCCFTWVNLFTFIQKCLTAMQLQVYLPLSSTFTLTPAYLQTGPELIIFH
jgi:hypothetical protein